MENNNSNADQPTKNLESGDHRFETLPQDIAENIFLDIFEKRDRLDWTNLNLVCKNWHKIAQIALERNSVIHRFNKALKTPFSCSGELDSDFQVDLWTRFGKTTFPCLEQSAILNLISLCKPASFGRGSVEVNDPEYRSALVLKPSEFATNFHPSNCNILNDVRRILAPRFHQVNCHLYRVNIYPAGGFFKVHKDTPQGEHHIGSLVVTLPTPHLGGDLKISHDFRTEKLDSSWDPSNCGGRIKWIAFYGDCDHWIEPVTSGFRVTLTYHLFTYMNPDSSLLTINEPIYSHLKDLLANQTGDGKKWAFFLKHEYTNKELSTACLNPASILRGSDALLYSAAVSLGIPAKIRAIFLSTAFDRNWVDPEDKCLMYSKNIPVDLVPPTYSEGDFNAEFLVNLVNAKFILPERITWCTPKARFRNLAGSTSVSTGNEPSTQGIYFQAALFLSTSESEEHKETRRKKDQEMDRALREHSEEKKRNGVFFSGYDDDWVNLLKRNGWSRESGIKWFTKNYRDLDL